jgi:hypothetical protein
MIAISFKVTLNYLLELTYFLMAWISVDQYNDVGELFERCDCGSLTLSCKNIHLLLNSSFET